MIADNMNARCRNQRRQLGDEFERLKHHVRRAIAPTPPQLIQQPAIVERLQPRGCNRRLRHVAAQPLQPLSIARRKCHTRMQPQARDVGAQRLRSCR